MASVVQDSATHNIGGLEELLILSGMMQPLDVVYCPDIDKIVVFMKNGNNDYTYVAAGSINTSNETTSWGSATLVASTNMEGDGLDLSLHGTATSIGSSFITETRTTATEGLRSLLKLLAIIRSL